MRLKNRAVSEFWVRGTGCSTEFAKVKQFKNLSAAERLLASVLADDSVSVHSAIASCSEAGIDEWIELTRLHQLSNFCNDYLLEQQLLTAFSTTQRARLVRYAAQEISFHKRANEHFVALIDSIPLEIMRSLLWIKGTALSQTVYSKPHHRVFCDFDVVVRRESIASAYSMFAERGFVSHFSPAYCNQIGSGPVGTIEDLMLTPHSDLIPSAALSLRKFGLPMIDLKFGPFDSGLQARDLRRMFSDALEVKIHGRNFFVPSLSDQLLISLHNFHKDRFASWKSMFDVHLLVKALTAQDFDWNTFVEKCRLEAVDVAAFAGLSVCVDRLNTPIPNMVLQSLSERIPEWKFQLQMISSPQFVWNSTSFFMLCANALASTDAARRMSLMIACANPSDEFLRSYYGASQSRNLGKVLQRAIHFANVFLPGGATRRTFGLKFWELPESIVNI